MSFLLAPVSIQVATPEAPTPEPEDSFGIIFKEMKALAQDEMAESMEESLTATTSYTLEAEDGDGITHLARKAVHQYLEDNERLAEYERAERIYVEDFLQNRVGDFFLAFGEAQTFTVEQIEAAIGAVQEIDTSSLTASLARFVDNVDWERYETLAFETTVSDSDETIAQNTQEDSATSDETGDDNGDTDIEAAQTENTNSSRRRTIVYVIIVIVVLVVAGYLLFKGTKEDSGKLTGMDVKKDKTRGSPEKPKKEEPMKEDKKDYTKTDNK